MQLQEVTVAEFRRMLRTELLELKYSPTLLSAKEAAAYLRISLRKLDDLVATGDLRPFRVGRKRLFTEEMLTSLLESSAK